MSRTPAEWVYDMLPNWYRHPETDVIILAEDMPWELQPA